MEAETSSADAEDSSATEAISLVAVLMVPTRSVMSITAWPIDSNASRVLSTVATPLWVRSALCETASAARAVSVWISPISEAIVSAADLEPSASFLTSSATTAKPRPCSPARAASTAALSASRLVWAAMVEMVSTMPSICSLRLVRPSIT